MYCLLCRHNTHQRCRQVALPAQSVFLHPTATALARLLPASGASLNVSAQQPAGSVDNGASLKVETSTFTVLVWSAPVLFCLQYLWRVLFGLASRIALFFVVSFVGWQSMLPLLALVLFFSELLTAATSAALLTCIKWLLVGRLRPSDASAGPQHLVFIRWRVGRLIQRELEPVFELIRGTVLQNFLLRALGTRVSASAVVETTGVRSNLDRQSAPPHPDLSTQRSVPTQQQPLIQ